MAYKLFFSPHAAKTYPNASPDLRNRFQKAVDAILRSPTRGPNIKSLKGALQGYYRYRAGGYRILYAVSSERRGVYVDYIQHRKDTYR